MYWKNFLYKEKMRCWERLLFKETCAISTIAQVKNMAGKFP